MKTRFRSVTIYWIDIVILFFCILLCGLLIWKYQFSLQASRIQKQLTIMLAVPNLDPEVASQINITDMIVDQTGKEQFQIVKKTEKASEHPVIMNNGNLVIAKHPKLTSLILELKSTEKMSYRNGIQYNWQVIKVGGNLIWETKFARFVGLVRQID